MSEESRQIAEILDELSRQDARLWVEGDVLKCRAPSGALTEEIRTQLQLHKQSIIGWLKQQGETRSDILPKISPVDPGTCFPLSLAQESLWFLHQLEPNSAAAYNLLRAVRLSGSLDRDALEQALWTVCQRHEAMRTVFVVEDDRPMQMVLEKVEFAIDELDLSALKGSQQQAAIEATLLEEGGRVFDLTEAPLFSMRLLRCAEDDHVLVLNAHHVIADAWSALVILREVAACYEGETDPTEPLRQFSDYCSYERQRLHGSHFDAHVGYWKERLANLPDLILPCSNRALERRTWKGASHHFAVPQALASSLREFHKSKNVTLHELLITAYAITLHRCSNQDDFAIGTSVAGRDRPEKAAIVGFLADLLVCRFSIDPTTPVGDLLHASHASLLEDHAHATVPHDLIVKETRPTREYGRNPHFCAMFLYLPAPPDAEILPLAGIEASAVPIPSATAKFDLSLMIEDRSGELGVTLEYASDLFEESFVRSFCDMWLSVLVCLVDTPQTAIQNVPLLLDSRADEIVTEAERVTEFPPGFNTLHSWFEDQSRQTPDSVALSCGERSVTYAQLDAESNRLAHLLIAQGCQPGELVGVCLPPEPGVIVAILAILKSGCAYVPLDPSYPKSRLGYLVQDARLERIVSSKELAEKLAGELAAEIICPSELHDELSRLPETSPGHDVSAASPAYVIYTSGSTGKPKGCVIEHRNVTRLFSATEQWFCFSKSDVWTLFHSTSFDFSVWEIWGPLLYGGRLVIVPHLVTRAPDAFCELLVEEGVTVLNQTPSAFRQLTKWVSGRDKPPPFKLRYVIFGGEALDLPALRPWLDRYRDDAPLLVNMYGITETTVHVTWRPIRSADVAQNLGSVIGQPIPDLTLHLLDAEQKPLPNGVPGELYVGGAGLARGYLYRDELTRNRFIPNPFGNGRLYRSGDIGRRLTDGDIEYLGRRDEQVKMRGFRIELGEIEGVLLKAEAVSEVRVILYSRGAEDKRLVAYVVGSAGREIESKQLREHCRSHLPTHMIPAAFVPVDSWPLTPHGKLDQAALPIPGFDSERLAGSFRDPSSPVERSIAEIWQEVLKLPQVGADHNFFDLGGDSIRFFSVLSKIRNLGFPCSLAQLYKCQTVETLAASIITEGGEFGETGATPFTLVSVADRTLMPKGVEDAFPLSSLQQGMIFESEIAPEGLLYHDVFSFDLELKVTRADWERAIRLLVQDHATLRTTFDLAAFSVPLQLVHTGIDPWIVYDDISAEGDAGQRLAVRELIEEEKALAIDYRKGPLIRFYLQQCAAERIQLTIGFHHAILDGWSVANLVTRLIQKVVGEPEAALATTSFSTFVALEKDAVCSAVQRAFWTDELAHRPTEAIFTNTSLDNTSAAPRQESRLYSLGSGELDAAESLCKAESLPLKSLFLAVHLRTLHEMTNSTSVTTGLVGNARMESDDSIQMLGLFVNTLPISLRCTPETPAKFIRETFKAEQRLVEHRRFPLSEMVGLAEYSPLFESSFNFVHFHVYNELLSSGAVKLRGHDFFQETEFPCLCQTAVYPHVRRIDQEFIVDLSRVSEDRLQRWVDCWRSVFERFVSSPQEPLVSIKETVAQVSIPPGAGLESEQVRSFVAPQSRIEMELFELAAEILGHRNFGVRESFFEIGGNSLLAVQIVSRIRDKYRIELRLGALFECPRISELADLVNAEVSKTRNDNGETPLAMTGKRRRRRRATISQDGEIIAMNSQSSAGRGEL